MNDTAFHATRMGQRYYEATMPALVRELARLNDNIERLLAVAQDDAKVETAAATKDVAKKDHR